MDKHGEAVECPAGVDADALVCLRRKYGMVLVSLLFIILAAVLLPRCIHAPPVAAPAPAPAEGEERETMLQLQSVVSVVWTVSLLVCSYLCFWIYTFSHTMGAAAVFFRVSYGVMLAYSSAGLVGPLAGMAAAHLSTAWASGLLGYALAEHRMRAGSERAADEAAARTREDQTLALVYCAFVSSLVTLFMALRVVWLVFFPSYSEEHAHFIVFELSFLIWMILYFWAIPIVGLLLRQVLVSPDFMIRVLCYYIAQFIPSVLCVLVSELLWMYYFGLQMMAMAAFFGYILAVNARRNEIVLARDQPLLKDLEQGGDAVQESASASTKDEA